MLQNNWAAFALIGVGVIVILILLWLEPPAPYQPLKDLVVEDVVVGTGEEAAKGDRVQVQYTGRLAANGAKFDSSLDRNEPFEFTLGRRQVIVGWEEGVAGMKVGGKRLLKIPARMAYGSQARGDKIPANSDLNFEVELVAVSKPLAELQIKDQVLGKGAEAKPGSRAQVHYTGRLLSSGKQFDSSAGKEPLAFTIGKGDVIPGWDQGVVGMKVGGKRELRIPARLAYGANGSPPTIPPDSDLVFDVELVGVQ